MAIPSNMFLNATSTFVESKADVSINDNSLRSKLNDFHKNLMDIIISIKISFLQQNLSSLGILFSP